MWNDGDGMSLKSLVAICMIGAVVEFGWAADEAVLVPHLIREEVPRWVVSMIYMANPVVGLWIQPWLGSWSDSLGKRIPFVLGLGVTGLIGLTVVLLASSATDNDESSSRMMMMIVTFVGFGLADISLDCLLIPGRALLEDTFTKQTEQANSVFTAFQLGGRLLALWFGSSRWTLTGLDGLFHGPEAHFFALMTLSALFLLISITTTICCVTDQQPQSTTTTNYQSIPTQQSSLLPIQSASPNTTATTTTTTTNNNNSYTNKNDEKRLFLVCVIQAIGWIGICSQSFFWTSVRGEQKGCTDLVSQGVVGIFVAMILPWINQKFGTMQVWCASELLFHGLMMMTLSLPDSSPLWLYLSALTGVNYAVHATNGLLVASIIVNDPSKRATTIAMINNALPAGQLITALTGGLIAQLLGNFKYTLFSYGTMGFIFTSIATSFLFLLSPTNT